METKPRILVTGGTGYIGSHTVVELQQAGYPVVIIDNLSNSNRDVLDGIERITGIRPDFFEGDCTDMETVKKLFKDYPGNTLMNLLDMMAEHDVKGIVFSSSCTVYGEPDVNPVTEQSPIKKATSPYGNTKQISEEIITDVINAGAPFKSVILRYFNPVGAHPSAEIGELPNGVPQNLIPFLTQTAIGIRKELSVFGNDYNTPDGSCIRDYIDVVDLAKAHVIAVERMLTDKSEEKIEIFNLGTGNGLSVLQLINEFETATGVKVPHKIVGRRAGDIEKVWANPAHANNVLGWTANTPIADTMRSAWAWQCKLRERGIM